MTDINNAPDLVVDDASPETTPTVESPAKDPVQAKIDLAVKSRLDREKASHKRTVDTITAEQTRLQTELETANQILEKYQSFVQTQAETAMKNLAKPVRDLLEKLEPLDQLEWLESNGDAVAEAPKRTVPALPNATVKPMPASDPMQAQRKLWNS